jgi:insertion element IS1 protein InsB
MSCGSSSAPKNNIWLIKAVDGGTGRTVAWMVGGRDAATCGRLDDKLRHLTDCLFYTDHWDAFAKHQPPERQIVGTAATITSEHDNSNTRHHLRRMTHRPKVVSKQPCIVYVPIKLWLALTIPNIFAHYQATSLSIFR